MIKLETGSDSYNDNHNKHHKYTLDEALRVVSKFRDESDYSRFIWLELRLKCQSNDCTQYNLFFVTDH